MGKRAPADEKPFNPVEAALVRSVLAPEPPQHEPSTESVDPMTVDKGEGTYPQSNGAPRPKLLRGLQMRMLEARPDKLNREKRVLLTQAEEHEVERLVSRVAVEVSTPVKLSHLLRACVALLRHAEDQVVDKARQAGILARPSNGDPAA